MRHKSMRPDAQLADGATTLFMCLGHSAAQQWRLVSQDPSASEKRVNHDGQQRKREHRYPAYNNVCTACHNYILISVRDSASLASPRARGAPYLFALLAAAPVAFPHFLHAPPATVARDMRQPPDNVS
jgi:hypothetical protein